MYSVVEQMSLFDQDMDFLKMSPDCSQATPAKTSAASSKKRQGSSKRMPIYLDLRKAGGRMQDASWEKGIVSHGVSQTVSIGAYLNEESGLLYLPISMGTQHPTSYLTLNVGEKPREPNPTLLSDILQDSEEVDSKYNLSPKACQGILNRASRRGKKLPPILEDALRNQVGEIDERNMETDS